MYIYNGYSTSINLISKLKISFHLIIPCHTVRSKDEEEIMQHSIWTFYQIACYFGAYNYYKSVCNLGDRLKKISKLPSV